MDSKACTECTRSCLSLHRAKCDPYPRVCSFFKVMFGKRFSEELIVPPKFSRTLKSLQGKNTTLEDSTGQKWDVYLSKVKGSLVFQRGWHDFSLDHGIQSGDFVVFHYFKGSHFVVHIFTRSGCERPALYSGKNYQNKRSKTSKDPVAREGSDGTFNTEFAVDNVRKSLAVVEDCPTRGRIRKRQENVEKSLVVPEDCRIEGSTHKKQDNVRKSLVVAEDCPIEGSTRKRPKVVPAEDFLVDSYFMTSRSTSFCREDDRDFLFDLSAFEMPAKKVQTDEKSIIEVNRCLQGFKPFEQLEDAQIGTASIDIEKCQIDETSPVAEMSPLLVSNEACSSGEEPNFLLKGSAVSPSDNKTSQRVATPDASEFPAAPKSSQPPVATARIVKTEQLRSQHDSDYWVAHHSRSLPRDGLNMSYLQKSTINNGERSLNKMVKPEPVDFCDSTSALALQITCSVQKKDESFLELPDRLPIKPCRQGLKVDQKLIMLRDPAGKLWPVIYQEKKGIKILATGWKEFRKYNSIQPGDQCTFAVENMEECTFNVEILHRLLGLVDIDLWDYEANAKTSMKREIHRPPQLSFLSGRTSKPMLRWFGTEVIPVVNLAKFVMKPSKMNSVYTVLRPNPFSAVKRLLR